MAVSRGWVKVYAALASDSSVGSHENDRDEKGPPKRALIRTG